VRRPAEPALHRLCLQLEIDVHPVEHLRFDLAQQVPRHLDVLVALLFVGRLVGQGLLANLDARGIEGHVLVLVRANQDNVLKPSESLPSGHLVQTLLAQLGIVGHAELSQTFGFVPFFEEPHPCVEDLV
jgi:hypothetical protein